MDSIQDTEKSSQDNEAFNQYKIYEVALDLKIELEHIKLQVVKEIKDLLIKEINIFKDSFFQQIDQTAMSCTKNKSYTKQLKKTI